MQIKFIGYMPDGSVVVIGSARLEDAQRQFGQDFSIDDLRELGKKGWRDKCTEIIEMPEGWESPTDRTFRNAWRKQGVPHPESPHIFVDMPHAREIHRDWIRRKRIKALAELDVEYQRADEREDKQAKREIAERKQRLRDLPNDPRIEQAQTPEELKEINFG